MASTRRLSMLVALASLVAAGLVLVGCTSHHHDPTPVTSSSATTTAMPTLAIRHSCPTDPDFQCSSIKVPLDRTGARSGTLKLNVEIENAEPAPKGYLVLLSGGPGQGGASYAESLSQRFPEVELAVVQPAEQHPRAASGHAGGPGSDPTRECVLSVQPGLGREQRHRGHL